MKNKNIYNNLTYVWTALIAIMLILIKGLWCAPISWKFIIFIAVSPLIFSLIKSLIDCFLSKKAKQKLKLYEEIRNFLDSLDIKALININLQYNGVTFYKSNCNQDKGVHNDTNS